MDLDYAPYVDVSKLIYSTEYSPDTVIDILRDKGYTKRMYDWILDNFKRIKM